VGKRYRFIKRERKKKLLQRREEKEGTPFVTEKNDFVASSQTRNPFL